MEKKNRSKEIKELGKVKKQEKTKTLIRYSKFDTASVNTPHDKGYKKNLSKPAELTAVTFSEVIF